MSIRDHVNSCFSAAGLGLIMGAAFNAGEAAQSVAATVATVATGAIGALMTVGAEVCAFKPGAPLLKPRAFLATGILAATLSFYGLDKAFNASSSAAGKSKTGLSVSPATSLLPAKEIKNVH
jgi:hypothetical protein